MRSSPKIKFPSSWIVGTGSTTVTTASRGNKVTYSTEYHGFLLTP